MDQGRQGRDQVDTAVVQDVRGQRRAAPASCAAADRGTTAAATTRASMKRLIVTRVQAQSTGGMRPDASENSQISPSTIVRAARAAGSHPHLASVLLQGRKSANIYASSGVIRGIPDELSRTQGGSRRIGL